MASTLRYALNKNKYLLDPELLALENLLRKSVAGDLRDSTLLSLGLATGARAQELLNIRRSDLNTYDQSIFIRGLKSSNDREIPIRDELFKQVLEVAGEVLSGDLIFQIGYHRLRQIWKIYRPIDKKFHCLRHTFAIRLYRKTKDIRLVQVALGHRNITNTMVYADYVYSQQELKKLIL